MVKRQITSPLAILLVALSLLAPSLMVWSPTASGDESDPVWPQFGRDERHTGEGPVVERGLPNNDPVRVWDFGQAQGDDDFVVSWGTVVGNFTGNLEDSSEYERESQHVVYVTATEDDVDGGWRTKLLIRDGETGELMWWVNLGKMKNNNGDIISDTDVLDRRIGVPTPAIADLDGDGHLEIAAGRTEGNISIFEPKIDYNSESDNYVSGSQVWETPDRYEAKFSLVRSSPSIMDLTGDGLPDVVFSGLFHNGDSFIGARVAAIKGTDASEIFKKSPQGTEISSPAILDKSPRFYSFITVYNAGQIDAWAWDEGGNPWSGWNPNSDLGPDVRSPDDSDNDNHPMLPSPVIADLTTDNGEEVLISVPAPDADGDGKLYVFVGGQNPERAQGWDQPVSVEGDIDGTPAVGDIDGDGKNEIVALSWWDRESTGDESFRVTTFNGEDASENWRSDETSIDTSYAGWTDDDGEHAVASPVLIDFTEDGLPDVIIAVTPEVLGLKGKNPGGEVTDEEFHYALPNRNNDNRMFDSPTVCDLNNDGAVDLLVSGSAYTANLTELKVTRGDIEFLNQTQQSLENDEADEGDIIDLSIRIHNKGTRDATEIEVWVKEGDREGGNHLPGSPFTDLEITRKSSITIDVEDWEPSSTEDVPVWVVIVKDEPTNPEIRYNNNNASRILYVWPAYGVDIEVKDNATQTGLPDSTVTFQLNATNLGRRTDDFTLSYDWAGDEGWDSEAEPPLTDMEGNETRDFTLNVTIPEDAEAGEHHLTLRATSQGNTSRFDEVELTVVVEEVHGLRVEAPVQEATIVPERSIFFELEIFNDGNLEETFTIKRTVEDGQNRTAWDNEAPGSITIGAGKSKLMNLEIISPGCNKVTCDTEWGEVYNVTVKVTSKNGTDGDDSDDITFNTTFLVTMAQALIEPVTKGVDQGETYSYTIHLFNLNETHANQTLNLTRTGGPSTWDPTLERSSVTLDRFDSTQISFNVTVPSGASGGDKATHSLRVLGEETGWEDNLKVTTTANPLVGLRLTPREEYGRTIQVSNEEEVLLKLEVTNLEPQTLDLELRLVEPDDRDWDYRFDPGDAPDDKTWSDTLGENEEVSVDFYITIGNDAGQGERIDVRFNVSSDDGRFSKELAFVFVVDPVYGVELSGPEGISSLLFNVSQDFDIMLANTGNGRDSINVTVEFDRDEWITGNIHGYEELDKDETKLLKLWMRPKANFTVGDLHEITVRASSEEDPTAQAQWSFDLVCTSWKRDPGSSMDQSSLPGGTATWTYTVSNPDENSLRFFFEVEDQPVEDWPMNMTFGDGTELDPDERWQGSTLYSVLLGPGESAEVDLNLIVPEDGTPGMYPFRFTLHASGYNDETDDLNVTIAQVFNHALVPESHGTIRVGGELTVSATLENLGNGEDTFDLSARPLGASGWTIVPVEDEVTVEAGDSQEVEFTITAAADPAQARAPPSSYGFEATATSQGAPPDHDNRSTTVEYQVSVQPFFDFELYPTNPTSQEGEVNADVWFSFQVNNTGNIQDTYDLTAQPSVPQLYPTFANNEESLTIEALDSGASNVRVNVPESGEFWTVTLTVTSRGDGSVEASRVLNLSVVQSNFNLIVKRVYVDPDDPKDGDTLTVTAILKAVDEDARGVTVQVLLDDSEIESFTVDLTRDQELTREVAKFKGKEGKHTIEVFIDPDNELEELEENDNSNDVTFTVDAEGDDGFGAIWLILILLVVIVGGGYYVYQQRSALTEEEKPDKGGALLKKSDRFPLIINCPGCAVKIKVNKPGGFRCPACKTIGKVNEKGKLGPEPSSQEKDPKSKETKDPKDSKDGAVPGKEGPEGEAKGPQADDKQEAAATVSATATATANGVQAPVQAVTSVVTPVVTPAQASAFTLPAVAGCPGCQTQIQLTQLGSNQCPACKAMLEVTEAGMVSLKPVQPGVEPGGEAAPAVTPTPAAVPGAPAVTAPGAAASEQTPEPAAEFPIIIRCEGCQSKVRVREPGKFRCPACKTTARISPQGKVMSETPAADDLDWGDDDDSGTTPASGAPAPATTQVHSPLSVACPHCDARIKVPKPGKFRCPACKSISRVHPGGKIESITKPEKGKGKGKGPKKSKKGPKKGSKTKSSPKAGTPSGPESMQAPTPTSATTAPSAPATIPPPETPTEEEMDWEDDDDDAGAETGTETGTGPGAGTPAVSQATQTTPTPVPAVETVAAPAQPPSLFPLELGCPTCGSPIRVPKPCKFRCPGCKEVGLVDGKGHVASENALKAAAEQARIAAARTPEGVMMNFQEHLGLTPEEAAQLYNSGLTSLREVKKASQKSLEEVLSATWTPTQVKRLRVDLRILDLDEIEGAEGQEPAIAPPAGGVGTPASPSSTPAPAQSPAPPPSPGAEETVEGPFEGGCPACNATIEVTGPGRFQCPHCTAISEMEADGTVTLLERTATPPAATPPGPAPASRDISPSSPMCAHCQVPVSVPGPGVFRCPSCLSVSELAQDGTVILKQTPKGQLYALCAHCQVSVQVAEPGMFRCPSCLSVSELDEMGQVTLKQGPDGAAPEPSADEGEAEVGSQTAGTTPTPSPRSANCGSCATSVMVPKPGKFRCPACKSISRLGDDGGVTLIKGPDGKAPEQSAPTPTSTPDAPPPSASTPAPAGPTSAGCPVCQAQVKVPKPGKFRCPACRAISRLAEDGGVTLVKEAPKTDAPAQEAPAVKKEEAAGDDAKEGADEGAEEWDLEDEGEGSAKEIEAKEETPTRKRPKTKDDDEEAKAREALRKTVSGGVRIGGF